MEPLNFAVTAPQTVYQTPEALALYEEMIVAGVVGYRRHFGVSPGRASVAAIPEADRKGHAQLESLRRYLEAANLDSLLSSDSRRTPISSCFTRALNRRWARRSSFFARPPVGRFASMRGRIRPKYAVTSVPTPPDQSP
jgi:hypothetical protein